jgi:hypothetical protein
MANYLENIIPSLTLNPFHVSMIPQNVVYIGAIGFEDRAFGFLIDANLCGKKLNHCVAIDYKPAQIGNDKSKFMKFARNIFEEITLVEYDRFCPEEFASALQTVTSICQSASYVILDISAMSKMLIVILLFGLKDVNLPVSVIYAPAKLYHPTEECFKAAKVQVTQESSDIPYFLTTDVYTVVTTTALSSITMQGAPLAIIAFPNFNYLEIAALLNETSAQKLFLIESVNNVKQDSWRLDAIRWVNRSLKAYLTPITYEVDALDINSTILQLDKLYSEWHLTHKLALSPTGGKLQAVATFCLKIMHPDIHIVYPAVKQFQELYTEGYLPHTEIRFDNFRNFTFSLNEHRRSALSEIEKLIKQRLTEREQKRLQNT